MKRGRKALVASVVLIVALLLATGSFYAGALYADTGGAVPAVGPLVGSGPTQLGRLVDQVDGIIKSDALVVPTEATETANTIEGMLNSLDDTHSAYYDPSEYNDLKLDESGEFFGIGVGIGLNKNGQPYITRVFENTPASRAGLKSGDVFTAVGSVRKAKWDLDQFVSLVRGPIGTKVTLEITRTGRAPFRVTLTRDRITVPNTMTKMYGDVGYVRLLTFNDLSAKDISTAIKGFDAKGAKGYVLDLRQNPGGLVTAAVNVASLFVKSGVIVRVDARGVPEEMDYATGEQITTKPLVVLVDSMSASASELLTGALKDYGRATIVGVRTYGKGSVQTVVPVLNGGAVKLTIAHYLTPLKHAINQIGVLPDVVVKMDPKLQLTPAKDVQLTKALEVLRSKL